MHVKIPGVKAKSSEKEAKNDKGPKIKALPNNFSLSGLMRFRDDWGTKKYANGNTKSGADGFGGVKNHQLLWQMFTKFDVGAGWTGEIDFLGAKDSDGDKRTTGENTDGYADINKAFVNGPLWDGKIRFGRMKGSTVYKNSVVLNEYYQGVDYTRNLGSKWKAAASYGKIDYATDTWSGDANRINSSNTTTDKKTGVTSTTYYYKSERGVGDSDLNPVGLGVDMVQAQTQYQATKDLSFDGGYWHLIHRGSNQVWSKGALTTLNYPDPDIGEVGFTWQATPKFSVLGHFAMSNYHADATAQKKAKSDSDQNKAYALTFTWGNVVPAQAHSRRFQLDLIHQERFSGIKSSYDLKNKTGEGQRGFIADYRYVPVTNVMFDFRWMHYHTLGVSDAGSYYHGNQYRVQLYYYF
jgi:hypothetical protein